MTPSAKRKRMGFSGGKDSTAMGERLFEMGEEFDLIFTPTGNELPGVFDHIYEMSERWKAPLIIPKGPKLEELILGTDTIPNFRQRWCTPGIKILPCLHWLKSHPDTVLCVGLRADEEERQGIYGMVVEYRFPLREWGWGIQEVWGYLKQRGIKIPKRTDCAWCYDRRIEEWYNLWLEFPDIFQRGVELEERVGHTFRSAQRDTWPAPLKELRREFERGRKPRGLKVVQDSPSGCGAEEDGRDKACRICRI